MLDTELLPRVLAGELDVVLLSGNPGDGKTSVLVQLGDQLRADGATLEHEDAAGWRMRLGDRLFTAVYDASESHGDLSSDQLVSAALDAVAGNGKATALIAVNDGRLLQFFEDHGDKYETWGFDVNDQLHGKETPGSRLALVDLKRRSLAGENGTAGPARKALSGLVDDAHWQACRLMRGPRATARSWRTATRSRARRRGLRRAHAHQPPSAAPQSHLQGCPFGDRLADHRRPFVR